MEFPTPDGERYQPLAMLHKGSFRSVLLLEGTRTGENLAGHLISPPPGVSEEQMMPAMQAQADRYRRLTHARLQPFLEFMLVGGQHWFLFRYIKGFPLHQFMGQTEEVPTDWITEWLIQLLEALQYLHGEGEVLGGLNPSDIVIDLTGALFMVDLGLLDHAFPEMSAMLRSETKAALMAPEERYTAQTTTSTDLFSAGAIAYWLVTGRLLKTPLQTPVEATAHQLQTARSQLPAPVAEVIAELIQFKPSARCSDATQALERLLPHRPSLERAEPPMPVATFGVSVRPLNVRSTDATEAERARRPPRMVFDEEPPTVESEPEPLAPPPRRSRTKAVVAAVVGVSLLGFGWSRMRPGSSAHGAAPLMQVTSGGIMINDKQGADWRPETEIRKGNTLVTAVPAQGTASLSFGKHGKLALDPGTTIRINEMADRSLDIRLSDGHAWLDATDDYDCTLEVGGSRVVCPPGSAADVALTPAEPAKVKCDKGTVTVKGAGQEKSLNAGEETSVDDSN
ncbi:MAG: serine/threonine protein kinase [Candidatus Xenobia bacterium]